METTRQPTCEELIGRHRESRLADFANLLAVVQSSEDDLEGFEPAQHLYDAGELDSPKTNTGDELRESAQERIWEYPLAISTSTVFRIDLSTGGPADWLEVVCDTAGEAPNSRLDVERIVYHYADWFDHAEDTLTGEDFNIARDFACSLIPELE